jgi:two-component system chemotaxis response regulator CheB
MSVSKGIKQMDSIGSPSGLTCPTCHGALWEIREGKLIRFRCHTGHGFSLGTLLAEQSDAVEEALYSAVRALKEKAAAVRHMIESVADTNVEQELDAIKLDEEADLIKNMLVTGTVSAVKADHLKD